MCNVLFEQRLQYSQRRLQRLADGLADAKALLDFPGLAIFAAGSYGRGEASEHSDIDLFLLHEERAGRVPDPRLRGIRVMSSVIRQLEDGDGFPLPSNDGQFFNILTIEDLLTNLGGARDDFENHFTTRLLLMLESQPVFGREAYSRSLGRVVEAYFRDYGDHNTDFRTTFLVNDIMRFWKTLCLNYEHARNKVDPAKKRKQQIRNFKLKFSRQMTCFATVGLLSCYNAISKDEVVSICSIRPIDRLRKIGERVGSAQPHIAAAVSEYAWFLEKTALSTQELEQHFDVQKNREQAFARARAFGQSLFDCVQVASTHSGTLRYLVI